MGGQVADEHQYAAVTRGPASTNQTRALMMLNQPRSQRPDNNTVYHILKAIVITMSLQVSEKSHASVLFLKNVPPFVIGRWGQLCRTFPASVRPRYQVNL